MRLAHLDGWTNCSTALSSPISAYLDPRTRPKMALAPDQFWALFFNGNERITRNCQEEASASRHSPWQDVRLATLALCRRAFPVLGSVRVDFDDAQRRSLEFPDLGWFIGATAGLNSGVPTRSDQATLTFRLSKSFAGSPVMLSLGTRAGHHPPAILVDGVRVAHVSDGSEISVSVSQELVQRGIREPLTLQLKTAGKSLDLTLLSLQARSCPVRCERNFATRLTR